MLDLRPVERPQDVVFWSAPSPESEFAPEDPLALDYISQQIGLFLLPTLTTRSARAQSYAVVLYGLDLAQRGLEAYGHPDDDEVRRLLFERWERFWALSVLEHRGGDLDRGDPDAMRGVRGALRAWFPGEKPLPLDFQLISRQQELGSLGAYLAPLRSAGLVIPGTLKPSPAATDVLTAFWDEVSETSHASRYDGYAMEALDLQRSKIERKMGNLTLRRIGGHSRLSSLVARERTAQQQRLYYLLVEAVCDRTNTTLPMSRIVEGATAQGIFDPREILKCALEGQWGELDAPLVDLLRTARAFGDAMDAVLRFFDRAYDELARAGWQAPRGTIAERSLAPADHAQLRDACDRFLASPEMARVQRLPLHGPAFVGLASELRHASVDDSLARLLEYHRSIQRERRRGESWIRDRAGHLTLLLTSYNARPAARRFPGYKLNVLRQLLVDVGRLQSDIVPEADEEASS